MAPSLHLILSTPSSPMGRVEKATSRALLGPESMMNLEICGLINTNPWQAKAYVKAVKKRLQNKNSKVQFLALTLLETMMHKCGEVLHFQVVDYEILQEMVKIIRRTRNMQVRDKILALLESWQEAFGGAEGKYPQYYYTYVELKRSGVRFPLNQRDEDLNTTITNQPQISRGMPSNTIERLDEIMESETSLYRMADLDLDNVRGVAELFDNMLQVVNSKDHQAIKDEVITDLANQCSTNQKKLMKLINSSENARVLNEALALNDNLQIVLSKYNSLLSVPPSLPEKSPELPSPSAPVPALPGNEEEEEEDGFSYIAKRKSVFKKEEDQEVSSNIIDMNTATSVKSATEGASNALILFEPPCPASSSKKEEDVIDFLSLTLTENQSSQTDIVPVTSSHSSNLNQNPFYGSPIMANYPRTLTSNEGYTAYNNYIAPWAQHAITQLPEPFPFPSQQLPQITTDSLPTPWTVPGVSSNPFQYTSYAQTQYPAYQSTILLGSVAVTRQGSRGHQNLNAEEKKPGPNGAPKPYMPDNLFDDLIELRNPDGSLKSRDASRLWGFSGQGMTSVN